MNEKILGKRANRGYNPKYDSEETQFLSKEQVCRLKTSGEKSRNGEK